MSVPSLTRLDGFHCINGSFTLVYRTLVPEIHVYMLRVAMYIYVIHVHCPRVCVLPHGKLTEQQSCCSCYSCEQEQGTK